MERLHTLALIVLVLGFLSRFLLFGVSLLAHHRWRIPIKDIERLIRACYPRRPRPGQDDPADISRASGVAVELRPGCRPVQDPKIDLLRGTPPAKHEGHPAPSDLAQGAPRLE
ncbi:hypothetical protein [Saccharopolyspora phatthalungensis]|uniref:Uncharacterized protein n=1 Tax=Saccharopolyspora phatthalungensis TaxID=664693 RepID=A0A840PW02_9PSEU|nr:hypothetical protein [Saccharopolyspora phatthalungensis]MBB5154452.1 hypothetical protein [Saccharopolyspora phatthalungensis]